MLEGELHQNVSKQEIVMGRTTQAVFPDECLFIYNVFQPVCFSSFPAVLQFSSRHSSVHQLFPFEQLLKSGRCG